MNELRFGAAAILMLMAGFVVVMNGWSVIASNRNKREGIDKHYSTIPLVSFVLVLIAHPLYPLSHNRTWISLIPAIDVGNWILLIGLPVAIARGAFKKKATKP